MACFGVMSDFQKSVDSRDGKPPEWAIPPAQPIEKDKKEKQPYPPGSEKELTQQQLLLIFTAFFKKILNFFISQDRSQMTEIEKQQISEDLVSLRSMLQILGNQDQSHHPEFTHHLAELWHHLIEDCQHVASTDPNLFKVKYFIDQVNAFPPNEDHSLGYYLARYAGKDWLPFPFMDMLQQLHKQYQENPHSSTLNEWVVELSAIVSKLDIKAELD